MNQTMVLKVVYLVYLCIQGIESSRVTAAKVCLLQQNLDCDQGSKVDIFHQISNVVKVLERSAQDKNCYYAEQNADQILDKVVLLLQIPAQW